MFSVNDKGQLVLINNIDVCEYEKPRWKGVRGLDGSIY